VGGSLRGKDGGRTGVEMLVSGQQKRPRLVSYSSRTLGWTIYVFRILVAVVLWVLIEEMAWDIVT